MIKANQNGTFLSSRGKIAFENFDAYPYKNQEENPSNLMIVNLYKSIVTGIFVKYQLPQETLCIYRNCDVIDIDKKWFRKTVMRENTYNKK